MKIINKIIVILIIFFLLFGLENVVTNLYENSISHKEVASYLIPEKQERTKVDTLKVKEEYKGILEIPRLNLKKGFYDSTSSLNNVDQNVTLLEPKTLGNIKDNLIVLAAHSGNSQISYFHNLDLLNIQDKVYLYFQDFKYTFKVIEKYEIEKDGTLELTKNENCLLYLTTCSEKDKTKQLVIISKLVSESTY